ncbi:hypothetical protein SAMD00019534_126450 [Acytostelium subglobosum LB1]|uniref:hypothetical protein n=1 Tax=Acytostelium subglobosum LB1 TaxID=1410327 RepID=UPI0006450AE3|nr:hypothetical protein SAMD00019534_126450 [Acytostelium subglobosum LB1]GAM29469.1 hypothetical protein SAMD00019534_126450 [Acytostelium subglobosum LB1]|eukprot:XP_012747582.1 hypothetical protein SAMD00019534_126450 [Acytostelium subglobosum LB1]
MTGQQQTTRKRQQSGRSSSTTDGNSGHVPQNRGTRQQQQQQQQNGDDLRLDVVYESYKHWSSLNRITAVMIVVVMLMIYTQNGDMTIGGDSNSNMLLALRMSNTPLLKWHSLDSVFGLTEVSTPCLFSWSFWADDHSPPRTGLSLQHWNITTQAQLKKNGPPEIVSAWQLYEMGRIKMETSHYNLVPTSQKGIYVNTFSIGTAIVSAPIFYVYNKLFHPSVQQSTIELCKYDRLSLLTVSKFTASLFTALSCGVMFMVFNRIISETRAGAATNNTVKYVAAIGLSVLYGLGTTLASINSQALWQHAPNTLFISLGMYFYIRLQQDSTGFERSAIMCSLSLSLATLCRPTSALYPLAVLLRLLGNTVVPGNVGFKKQATKLLLYGSIGAVIGAAFLYHNHHFFQSPFTTGQTVAAEKLATSKTGLAGSWTTPFWTGASTLFFSPSRGLFTHSPFLIFALMAFFFSDKQSVVTLAPFIASTTVLTYAASTFFDYWGGWCFGARPLTDTMSTYLALIAASIPRLHRWQPLALLLACTGALSIVVHMIGMYSYDPLIWNYQKAIKNTSTGQLELIDNFDVITGKQDAPPGTVMVNIDDLQYRWRLWDWINGQPIYLLKHLSLARAVKKNSIQLWIKGQLT